MKDNNNAGGDYEAVGLFYGGFVIIGAVVGVRESIVGALGKGHHHHIHSFLYDGGWIDALCGAGLGSMLGVGVGLVVHGIFALLERNKREKTASLPVDAGRERAALREK